MANHEYLEKKPNQNGSDCKGQNAERKMSMKGKPQKDNEGFSKGRCKVIFLMSSSILAEHVKRTPAAQG